MSNPKVGLLDSNLNPININNPLAVSGTFSVGAATYTTRLDEVDGSTTLVGEALPGTTESASTWRIKALVVVGDVTLVTWAGGNANFDKVWDDRNTYDYT